MELSQKELKLLSETLKSYFPWLGVDEEDLEEEVSGADTISELEELFSHINSKIE